MTRLVIAYAIFQSATFALAEPSVNATLKEHAMNQTSFSLTLLSSKNGDLPIPGNSTQQTASLILDVDKDGLNDFIIGARQTGPSVVWFRRVEDGWQRYIIDDDFLPIEAGGAFYDIDGDGDLDIVFGADASGNKLWWWENPYPNYNPNLPWKRHEIKTSGANKHHDQIFGDFDGDGKAELVFWNQGANKLFIAKIPPDPKAQDWPYTEIYSGDGEGLASGDIDSDGKVELLAGGRWFKHNGGTDYTGYLIDDSQYASRIAAADLNRDGKLEVVMVPADGIGRLKWYEFKGDPKARGSWVGHDLLGFDVRHGHSLAIADFDGDGNLDIFCAEMRKWTNKDDNPDAKMWIFLGDGCGKFRKTEIASGFCNHESKVADLDGDGKLDILSKPYNWEAPKVDVWLSSKNEAEAIKPISLHPDNGRYFLFRDKATVLITSAEHYGSVLNLDFDYISYLKTLHKNGLNLTRIFSGAYVEESGAFKIAKNTLAPAPGRFICPWARSSTPGYADRKDKFDLDRWDEEYFRRLKDFCRQAGKRGIVVEFVLFCPYYDDAKWDISPLKSNNNINGVGDVPRTEALTMKHPDLVSVQDKMVRKVVSELREFDNLYYEICNEPYFGGVTMDWQRHIASVIVETESSFPYKHLIAQNISNGSAKVENPDPSVSIFNFHYAFPPEAVALNYELGKVIGDDETGFKGTGDSHYRMEGWDFIIAGGGVYNNLDYSFAAGYEDGTFLYPSTQPGGGSQTLRNQLKILSDFIHSFDFIRMRPDPSIIKGGLPSGYTVRVLAEAGKGYAIYIKGGNQVELVLDLPQGRYQCEWLNTHIGVIDKSEAVEHGGGEVRLSSPVYAEDAALKILNRDP